jgi:hypothetical protein
LLQSWDALGIYLLKKGLQLQFTPIAVLPLWVEIYEHRYLSLIRGTRVVEMQREAAALALVALQCEAR